SQRVAASYSSVTKASERPPQKPFVGLAAVPAEEDYEVRATSSITDANLLDKLAELERELRP
ncbi:MAG TPA: hypothetical protein VJV79_16615, partial [Polyangiaceae bacterium]|nr:hypothetical protein [Polyangiaceae bacterium]